MFRKVLSLFFILLHVSSPHARSSQDQITDALDAIFSPLANASSPGLAVLVRKDGRTAFERGYGARELRSFAKIDPQTNFRLASCSKQFTAMSIMLLVHDGRLRYEAKLTDVFPEFPAYGKAITIRNLLNHTSGLPDYEDLMAAAEKRRGAPIWTPNRQIQDAEVLDLLKQEAAGKFVPGTQWSYSNSGYVVLGLVVAKISGKPFREFLRERIFAPLKMSQTVAYQKGQSEVTRRAYGHSKEVSAWKETDQSPTSATLGDGGIYSSLTDLAKWDEALAQHTLLSEKEMQPALTPAQLINGTQPKWPANSDRPEGAPVSYGFGWFLDPYRNHARMWHYGDTIGFHTYILRFPSDRLTIIILCNRTDLDPESLAIRAAELFLTP
ncbi:MAG TPA: serine hydrolase domain-containing protein [Candidatus Acidoferrum sp.]|nr:serine hydrolase domain-containing protein [Candidatus Acidoferrum sp.]